MAAEAESAGIRQAGERPWRGQVEGALAVGAKFFGPAFRLNHTPIRGGDLARIAHHLTVEARHRPAITALRLLAVLNVLFEYARIIQEMRRRASRALY